MSCTWTNDHGSYPEGLLADLYSTIGSLVTRPLADVLRLARVHADTVGRSQIGEDDIGMTVLNVLEEDGFDLGVALTDLRQLITRYWSSPHPAAATTNSELDRTGHELLELADDERERAGHNAIEPRHLLCALLTLDGSTVAANARSLGLTANAARRRFGLPTHSRNFTSDPTVQRRPEPGFLFVLLGGGTMTTALPDAIAYMQEKMRSSRPARIGVIGACNRWGGANLTRRLRRIGADAIDLRLDQRNETQRLDTDGLDAIYFAGGDASNGVETLAGTRALDDLVGAVDDGVIVMGHSAGAILVGISSLSWWKTQDDPVPTPMLGWIPAVIVPHHLPDGVRLRAATTSHPGHDILPIGHDCAIAGTTPGDAIEIST